MVQVYETIYCITFRMFDCLWGEMRVGYMVSVIVCWHYFDLLPGVSKGNG